MPSADRSARRGWIVAGLVVALVVAVAVTVARSQPDGLGPAERQSDAALAATAGKRSGTTCAGWPLALTPANRPVDVEGAVAVWGQRDAIHVANAADAEVVVDLVAVDGSLRPVDASAEQVADDHLRATLAPGAEASFTATCATAALAFASTPREVGFATAQGRAPSPLTLEKQRRG